MAAGDQAGVDFGEVDAAEQASGEQIDDFARAGLVE
jgi:hypothetical protein